MKFRFNKKEDYEDLMELFILEKKERIRNGENEDKIDSEYDVICQEYIDFCFKE